MDIYTCWNCGRIDRNDVNRIDTSTPVPYGDQMVDLVSCEYVCNNCGLDVEYESIY